MTHNLNALNRNQREAVALLSIGTFLEYFDLMLYIHMAVLLNGLFFSQDNPLTNQLLTTFTFCSTYIMRPVGGFVIGQIGDRFGRKVTIVLTTGVMAGTCITMATLGTYAEIGIMATIVVMICRMLQGFSSMGEIVGAQLYLTESLKRPHNYTACGMVEIGWQTGSLLALFIALVATSGYIDWRIAFWIGGLIAIIGITARTKLRETPEFVDYKRRMKIKLEINRQNPTIIKNDQLYKERIDKKAVLAFFLVHSLQSSSFFIIFVFMGSFMKGECCHKIDKMLK
ncbi:MFS transporter [Candidatus Bandiella euplotis]|uniref:MFS transporter N-terminal domain protein n=1 Tax=Candidatus Bandiella euplotis TaxID=1664265 RepID=A0ABZ0UKS6_9RICK|nr:MFS transporter [Candidatus Bandiella woodruffii]WPX96716.1 MFS transporter N-terminal domain protein [Candidatus Bandiella woodruffii]